MQKYVVQFLDEWSDFRYAEFLALVRLEGVDPSELRAFPISDDRISLHESVTMLSALNSLRSSGVMQHFFIFEFPDENALMRIANRAVLVKSVYEYWTHANSLDELVVAVQFLDREFIEPLLSSSRSWCIQVGAYGRSFSMSEKQQLRNRLAFLEFSGPVNITDADMEFWLTLDFSRNLVARKEEDSRPVPAYFGRRLRTTGMKETLRKYSLKTRLYLGPTSLDDSLSFILANMVGAKAGMMSFEPFMGTGSIAIALSHLGCCSIGCDIDPRVLRGDSVQGRADVRSNFSAYKLPAPELIRLDSHCLERHLNLGVCSGMFDIIVTDPPYGIRAGARKSGKRGGQGCAYALTPEQREDHVPSTQTYAVEEVMLDLLHNASLLLRLHGLLVYLLPTTYDFSPDDLPWHPCLTLREVCHQPLSSRHGRRAVLLEKTVEPVSSADLVKEFSAYKMRVLSGEDSGFGQLSKKLEEALSTSAFENEQVIKQFSQCSHRRHESKKRRRQMGKERAEAAKLADVTTASDA